jgi:hypothetical protein
LEKFALKDVGLDCSNAAKGSSLDSVLGKRPRNPKPFYGVQAKQPDFAKCGSPKFGISNPISLILCYPFLYKRSCKSYPSVRILLSAITLLLWGFSGISYIIFQHFQDYKLLEDRKPVIFFLLYIITGVSNF